MAKIFQFVFALLVIPFVNSFSISAFNQKANLRISQTTIFAGTPKGLSISNNDGISWPTFELPQTNIYSIVSNGNGTLYLSNNVSLLKSGSDDQTWINLTEGIGSRDVQSFYVTANEKEIYIGSPYNLGNLRYTHDGGKVWGEKTIAKKTSIVKGLGEIDGTIFALAHDTGLYSSSNRGDSWKLVAFPTSFNYNFGTAFYISNDRIYIGTNGGLLITADQGKTWTTFSSKQGLADDYIYTIFVKQWPNSKNETVYVGTPNGLSYSDNYGQTWKTLSTYYVVSVYVTDDNTIYVGSSSNGLSYTSDGLIWFTATKDDGLADNNVSAVYAEARTIKD